MPAPDELAGRAHGGAVKSGTLRDDGPGGSPRHGWGSGRGPDP